MEFFRAFMRALQRRRTLPFFETFRSYTARFTPLDWFVVSVLSIVMALSAATMVAGVSLALTTEIPSRGGSYSEGIVGSPRFVNPVLAVSETDRDLTMLIFSGLMRMNPDGTLVPDLAESYKISEDLLTYTFVLKEDARFHDGSNVTPEDVVFTVRAAQNPDIKSPRRADWEGVAVVATDNRTIVFTLGEPYALFLENTSLGILPKKLWGNITPEEFPFTTLNTNPVGSGPYDVTSVRENSSGIPVEFTLRAFEGGVRVPYITNFTVRFYTNEEELVGALNRGEVRAGSSINPAAITRDVEIHEAIFGRVFGVFLNQNQNTLFAESAVREALQVSLDKKQIIDTVLGGYGSAIDGPLPPQTKDASSETSSSSRIEEAREILRDSGWKEGEDGIFEKTKTVKNKKETTRLAFSLTTSNNPELKQAAELTAEAWKNLGAEVTLKFFEQNDLTIEVIRPREYDALLFGEVVGRNPDLFAFWHSSQKNDPGLNIALYANSDVDKKLEKARTEHDSKLRRKNLEEAAEEIRADFGALFLYAPHFVYLAPREVAGVTFGTIAVPSDRFDSVHEWYLSTERVWPIFMFDIKNLFK
ncbi:hypothetical protein K2P56_02660 [Patescibacteria group bacterium]|nr:hypothetical protein [Patescibacteria group bacterium]